MNQFADQDGNEYLSGFIGIAGPPNVGKSTLLNRILGAKVSIVSPKPQTTRNRIMGVYHRPGLQMIFMDTPGIHSPKTPLHRSMVASAEAAFQEVDIILSMIEVPRAFDPNISVMLEQVRTGKKPTILVINKIDMALKEALLPIMEFYSTRYSFDAIVPVSALKGDGLEDLLGEIRERLVPGPAFFPEDMTTDQAEPFLVSEIIREKIYFHTKNELPYSTAVSVESIEEVRGKKLITISALIHVESDSQKAILIGHKGRMVKAIGQASRIDLERFFGSRIFLDLLVRVEKNWSKDPKALRKMGY